MPQIITIPKALREKLGDDGADSIVELINLANQKVKEDVIEVVGEKFERKLTDVKTELNGNIANVKTELNGNIANVKTELKEDIANVKAELKEDIANVKAELKEDITNVKAELKEDIANVKAELIKWMFIFWIGQFAAIVGTLTAILFAFFK